MIQVRHIDSRVNDDGTFDMLIEYPDGQQAWLHNCYTDVEGASLPPDDPSLNVSIKITYDKSALPIQEEARPKSDPEV